MSNTNKPLPYEFTRYTVAIEQKLYDKVKHYSARKQIPLAVNMRRWIKEGYMRDKEKDKMDI